MTLTFALKTTTTLHLSHPRDLKDAMKNAATPVEVVVVFVDAADVVDVVVPRLLTEHYFVRTDLQPQNNWQE